MNALVISGGGSKGAFAGGVAEYLIKDCQKEYQLFVGTSTGSLLAPLLAIGEIDRLKKAYTTIRNEDIFTSSPFKIVRKNGTVYTRINHFGIIMQFIKGQKTFGNSEKLRFLIKKIFTPEDFKRLQASGKEAVVTVANLTKEIIEYKSSNDYNYEDFCDWMWASANLLPFMSLLTKDNQDYGDGGFGNLIPVQHAITKGAHYIDVVVLNPEKRVYTNKPIHNVFDVLTSTFDFMLNQIAKDDLIIANLEAGMQLSEIHFYYTNRILTEQSFLFDAEQMRQWWQDGYELYKVNNPTSHVIQKK